MDKALRVTEIFGPTIQGEGRQAGASTYFIRFAGCDLRCSWCDSPHSVLPELFKASSEYMTPDEIIEKLSLLPRGPQWVVLTGGNPGLFALEQLIGKLQAGGYKVMVETQGTVWKDWFHSVDELCLSPKPPSSGNTVTPEMFADFLKGRLSQALEGFMEFYSRAYIKVVVFDEEDYYYAVDMHESFPKFDFYISGGTYTDHLPTVSNPHPDTIGKVEDLSEVRDSVSDRFRWVCETVSHDTRMRDVKALPQLHVLAWGNERAR